MALARTSVTGFAFGGTNANNLNLRWASLTGTTSNDTVNLNKKHIGGWGTINSGAGDDSVHLGAAGNWSLRLLNVETIERKEDTTGIINLRLIGDTNINTNGSLDAITATYGIQNVTFTGADRDNTISLGSLEDTVTFDATTTEWQGFKEDGRVYIVDLNTGYEVEISSDVEYVRIINSSTSSYNTANYQDNANHSSSWVDGWVDVSALQDGDTFGANLADAITNAVQFLSTTIEITAEFGGYAGAYGTTEALTSGFGGYWHYAGDPGWAMIGDGSTSVITLEASTEVNSSSTVSPLDGFTWVFFMGDDENPYGYSFGGTRLIIGTDNDDSSGAMDQTTDTLASVYGTWWETDNYAMYGFDGDDVILAGAFNDTVWGGDGNDTITGGAGADTMSGEGDTDTVSYADVTASTSHDLANLSGVAINLTGSAITAATVATAMGGSVVLGGGAAAAGASLAAGSAGYLASAAANSTTTMVRDTITDFESVIGSGLADFIALGAGGMAATGGAGADYILGGAGNDVINYTATANIVASNAFIDSVVGGDGSADAINLTTATGVTIAVTDSWARIGTVEKITAGASAGVISITAHDNITAAGITAIDLSGDTNATGSNVVNISGDTTGSIITAITGSAGIDTITGNDAAQTITGGAENDVINYTATANIVATNAFIDSVVGGDGSADAINLTTATGVTIAVTDSWTRIGTVEKITAGASAGVISITAHDNITAAGITAIDLSGDTTATGTNVVDISGDTTGSIITAITGSAGINIITGSAVAQTITGGAENDVINYTATANIVASNAFIDSVVGGAGSADAINLTTATGVTIAVTDSWARIGTVEKITAGASAGVISITAHDNITAAGITAIDLSGDTNATGSNVVNISGDTTGSIITAITGSAGIDTITGSAVAQTITGGAGADVINGGAGIDTYKIAFGGEGEDTITFVVADDIIDFTGTSDVADTLTAGEVSLGDFAEFTIAGGSKVLDAGMNVIEGDAGGLTAADVETFLADIDSNGVAITGFDDEEVQYIVVDDGTHSAIFKYESDGNGAAIEAAELTLIATLTGLSDATTLTAANFADFV